MYCPHCGVNNDRGEAECFICHKPLPAIDEPAAAPSRERADRGAAAQQHTLASVGDRMIALFFDRVVIVAILIVLGALAAEQWRGYSLSNTLWNAVAVGGAVFVVTFLYHFLSEAMFLTTIGKAAMGLHIGIETGRGRLGAAFLRNLLRIIDAIGLYLVGFLFVTFTRQRQRVGDLVAKTVVLEWPIARAGRAVMMFMILVILAAALWGANALCPSCSSVPVPGFR